MKRIYCDYAALYTFFYGAIGVLTPLIGQYLAGIGFTGTQIGTITAAGTAVAIFSAIFWGSIYNNSKNKERIAVFVCLGAAGVCLAESFIKDYGLFLLSFGILYFFHGTIMPFADAMTLEARQPFGAVRKWGAAGFAASVFISGQLAELLGLQIIFYLYSIGFTISAILIIGIIKKNRNQGQENRRLKQQERVCYREVLRNKRFVKLLICSFFICGTNVANNTYFGFLYTQTGGSLAGIGIAFLLMAGSETPFMAWADKLSARFSIEKVLLTVMCVSALRFLWYSTSPPWWLILAMFFLQGIVNGILLVELVRYISLLVPVQHTGMAMALYYSVGSNCSTIVCQLIGGAVLDYSGGSGVYLYFGVFNFVGVILYMLFGLSKKIEKRY